MSGMDTNFLLLQDIAPFSFRVGAPMVRRMENTDCRVTERQIGRQTNRQRDVNLGAEKFDIFSSEEKRFNM